MLRTSCRLRVEGHSTRAIGECCQQVVAELRADGHSERAIAGAVGVSQPTVHRNLERTDPHESTGEDSPPDRIIGLDGKSTVLQYFGVVGLQWTIWLEVASEHVLIRTQRGEGPQALGATTHVFKLVRVSVENDSDGSFFCCDAGAM